MRQHGVVIIDGEDGRTEQPTLQCAHCGKHWIPRPGSGVMRGFCTCCMKPVCGSEACNRECLPIEKRLDLYEKGKLATLL